MPSYFPNPVTFCLAGFGCACAISWLLTAALVRWAPRWRLVDLPSARKMHKQPTPKGGGLAIYSAFVVGTLLFSTDLTIGLAFLLGVGAMIVALGLADDLRPLSWQIRLVAQTLAAAAMVFALPAGIGGIEQALAVVWIVGLTNAFNMLDNMDALSAGVAWTAAAILALAVVVSVSLPSPPGKEVAELSGQQLMPLLLFMGALSGFLWFNRPPARIFMGDAGSTFLGFFLGFESLVIGSAKEERVCLWAMPFFVLAVAWYDLVFVVILRLSQGRSPFHADKQHLSHRLVELGLRPPTAVRVIYLLALASGMGGVVLYQLNDTRTAVLIAVALACWWVAFAGLELGALAGRTMKKHEG